MKAQGVQCRPTFGARKSRGDDWHRQSGPGHGTVFRVREAQGSFSRHGSEEDGRPQSGQVGPETPFGLRH
eukprot:694511-Alexandrium_andersonii.AAC.1